VTRSLDQTDWRIIAELQRDARQSYNQLAGRIAMSAPALAERIRRLEQAGVITGYQALIDTDAVGLPLTAFVQMRCTPGRCLLKTTSADDFPEVAEVHKLSGNSCTMLKVRTASMAHLEGLLERLGNHGEINSHIVLSTHYDHRPIQPPPDGTPQATRHAGWSH
jgi:Lrp/AsnC family leucine-responsive transcriptional regulator